MRVRTSITTFRKVSRTLTNASNVFDQMMQASQTKFKIFKKKKRKQTNENSESAFLSHVKLKHFLLKNSKFIRLNNVTTKNSRINSKKIILKVSTISKVFCFINSKINQIKI